MGKCSDGSKSESKPLEEKVYVGIGIGQSVGQVGLVFDALNYVEYYALCVVGSSEKFSRGMHLDWPVKTRDAVL